MQRSPFCHHANGVNIRRFLSGGRTQGTIKTPALCQYILISTVILLEEDPDLPVHQLLEWTPGCMSLAARCLILKAEGWSVVGVTGWGWAWPERTRPGRVEAAAGCRLPVAAADQERRGHLGVEGLTGWLMCGKSQCSGIVLGLCCEIMKIVANQLYMQESWCDWTRRIWVT